MTERVKMYGSDTCLILMTGSDFLSSFIMRLASVRLALCDVS